MYYNHVSLVGKRREGKKKDLKETPIEKGRSSDKVEGREMDEEKGGGG